MASKNTKRTIVTIVTCVAVAAPILCLPVGLRDNESARIKVRRAYAAAFPDADEQAEAQKLIDQQLIDEMESTGITAGEGVLVQQTYNEGYEAPEDAPVSYSDIQAYTVFQDYDEADLPIELLDPQYFAPDESTYYIKAGSSILKEDPVMDSITVASLDYGEEVTRIGIGDTWSKIRTDEGLEGYVLTSTLSVEMVWTAIYRDVWVDTGSLTLRAEPSTQSEVVATLYDEQHLVADEVADKWYHVTTNSGLTGYVYRSYTTQTPPPTPTPTPVPRRTEGGGGSSGRSSSGVSSGSNYVPPVISGVNGESVVSVAQSLLGVPYVFAGESSSGVDCSGLVVYCYRYIGVNGLPHLADSLKNYGQEVSRADARPGDIICYNYGGSYCGHVAIYIGGGQVIHASSSRGQVVYGNMDMMSILTIRRVIG